MSTLARIVFIGGCVMFSGGCGSPSEDALAGSSALRENAPVEEGCPSMLVRFDNIALLRDLEKTLSPEFSSTGNVVVPGALTAGEDSGAFTEVLTVLGAKVSFLTSDDSTERRPLLEISGGFPDPLNGERAAHRLFDAMTRGVELSEWKRVSRDGHFECHGMGWKGGTLYSCSFPRVMDMRVVPRPSHLCD
jgi:hypothetical protein